MTQQVSPDGAWIWFQQPMAVHYEGAGDKTYWSDVDAAGDIRINEYDHNTGTVTTTELRSTGDVDDHHNGAIYVRSDGRISVFYARHGPDAPLYQRISSNPEDISTMGTETALIANSERHAYPNPAYLSQEDTLYVSYRDQGYEVEYMTSPDEGDSWSGATQLFVNDGGTDDDRVYHKTTTDWTSRIHYVLSPRVSGGNPHDIRHCYYESGAYYQMDGTKIADAGGQTEDGAIYHWSFEGADGDVTDEVSGLNGTVGNNITRDVAGAFGTQGFDFAGGRIDVPEMSVGSEQFMAAAAYQPDTLDASDTAIRAWGDPGQNFILRTEGQNVYGYLLDSDGNIVSVAGGTTLSTGTMYVLGIGYDGSDLNVFVDGSVDGSLAIPGRQDPATTIQFGTDYNGQDPADGVIDEPAIWNYYDETQMSSFATDGSIGNTAPKTASDLPINAQNVPAVYDSDATGNYPAWVWDVELDSNGYPAIAYHEIRSQTDMRYRYARWDGAQWTDVEITSAGVDPTGGTSGTYSGGIQIDPTDVSVVYLSHVISDTDSDIQRWTTNDGGSTWQKTHDITSDDQENLRPIVPDNRHQNLDILWMQGTYADFQNYDTAVMAYDTPAGGSGPGIPIASTAGVLDTTNGDLDTQ